MRLGAYGDASSQPQMVAPEIVSSAWEAGAVWTGLQNVGANQATIPQPFVGQPIYRVFGGNALSTGASWTPINPAEVNGFRSFGALPSGGVSGSINTGQFVLEGILISPSQVIIIRPALPLDGHPGGILEYVIPNWNGTDAIRINRASGANPGF
jgi:hypothetical protein